MEAEMLTLIIVVLCHQGCLTVAQFINLSSSLQQSGRSHACPGETVTYTCETNGTILTWLVDPYVTLNNAHTFARTSSIGDFITTVPEAVRSLVSNSPTLLSTMVLSPSGNVENTTVVCLINSGISASLPYRILGLPSPPQNLMVIIVQNETTTVTVNIDWDPPVNNGGGFVDSYIVETSPETATVRVTSGTTTTLDLSYNERYVVSVTAVNCIGNSTPTMTDPVEFVNCFTPSTNLNMTIEHYSSTTEGSVISYQCRPGFIPEGRMMSVCGSDGRWTPDPEQYSCREVNCGAPRLPVNSTVLSGLTSSTGKGSEVTFQCNEGLLPSNEITIVCTSEERWSPDPEGIMCREQLASCSHPSAPRNGFLEEVSFTTLMFGCIEGYSPQGTMTAVCVATDTWSPDPTQLECLPSTCTCTPNSIPVNQSSVGIGVAAAVVVIFLLVVIVILVIVILVLVKRQQKVTSNSSEMTESPPLNQPQLYDEIVPRKQQVEVELQENVAYGPIVKTH